MLLVATSVCMSPAAILEGVTEHARAQTLGRLVTCNSAFAVSLTDAPV